MNFFETTSAEVIANHFMETQTYQNKFRHFLFSRLCRHNKKIFMVIFRLLALRPTLAISFLIMLVIDPLNDGFGAVLPDFVIIGRKNVFVV